MVFALPKGNKRLRNAGKQIGVTKVDFLNENGEKMIMHPYYLSVCKQKK